MKRHILNGAAEQLSRYNLMFPGISPLTPLQVPKSEVKGTDGQHRESMK